MDDITHKERESLIKISKQGNCKNVYCADCYLYRNRYCQENFNVYDDSLQYVELIDYCNKILKTREHKLERILKK